MKKIILIVLSVVFVLVLAACNKETENEKTYSFKGRVVEMYMNNLIVEPLEDEEIRQSYERIQVWFGQNPEFHPPLFPEGTLIEVEYVDKIDKAHPAQINAVGLRTIDVEGNDVIPQISQDEENGAENNEISIEEKIYGFKPAYGDMYTIEFLNNNFTAKCDNMTIVGDYKFTDDSTVICNIKSYTWSDGEHTGGSSLEEDGWYLEFNILNNDSIIFDQCYLGDTEGDSEISISLYNAFGENNQYEMLP